MIAERGDHQHRDEYRAVLRLATNLFRGGVLGAPDRWWALAVLIKALVFSIPAMAQTAEPAPTATSQEAYQSALQELDRAEGLDESELTSAILAEVNRRLVALQGTEANHPRLPYLFGRLYALSGRRGDAIEQLRRFVETREGRNEWEAHRRLGDLFVDEFPRLAQGSYERAAELKADEPTVLVGLSTCAYKVGRIDEALRVAEKAAAADRRRSVRVVSHLARMYIAKQQWGEAQRAATQAMDLAEADVKARPGTRGPLHTLHEQYQLVIDLIQTRIAERVATSDDYLQLSRLIRGRNDVANRINLHEALTVLEAGVKATTPNTPLPLLQEYAVTLAEAGRRDEAIAAFEKLLTTDPSNVVASKWLKELRTDGTGKSSP